MGKKMILSLLSLILINYAVLVVLIFSLERHYLNPSFYAGSFGDKLSQIIVDYQKDKKQETPEQIGLKDEDFAILLEELFSKDNLVKIISQFLQDFKVYHAQKRLAISLAILKQNSQSLSLKFAQQMVKNLPICQNVGDAQVIICRPQKLTEEVMISKLKDQIVTNLFDYIPNEIQIDNYPLIQKYLSTLSKLYDNQNKYYHILLAIGIIILSLIGAVTWKPWFKIVSNEGIALLITGISLLLTSITLGQMQSFMLYLNPLISEFISKNFNYFLSFILNDFILIGAISSSIGLALIIFAKLLKSYKMETKISF